MYKKALKAIVTGAMISSLVIGNCLSVFADGTANWGSFGKHEQHKEDVNGNENDSNSNDSSENSQDDRDSESTYNPYRVNPIQWTEEENGESEDGLNIYTIWKGDLSAVPGEISSGLGVNNTSPKKGNRGSIDFDDLYRGHYETVYVPNPEFPSGVDDCGYDEDGELVVDVAVVPPVIKKRVWKDIVIPGESIPTETNGEIEIPGIKDWTEERDKWDITILTPNDVPIPFITVSPDKIDEYNNWVEDKDTTVSKIKEVALDSYTDNTEIIDCYLDKYIWYVYDLNDRTEPKYVYQTNEDYLYLPTSEVGEYYVDVQQAYMVHLGTRYDWTTRYYSYCPETGVLLDSYEIAESGSASEYSKACGHEVKNNDSESIEQYTTVLSGVYNVYENGGRDNNKYKVELIQ